MTEEIGAKQNVWMRAAMGGRLGSRLSGLGIEEGASLPSRLQGLAELPWFECWLQRLKTGEEECSHYQGIHCRSSYSSNHCITW